jgi:hypothetical protein
MKKLITGNVTFDENGFLGGNMVNVTPTEYKVASNRFDALRPGDFIKYVYEGCNYGEGFAVFHGISVEMQWGTTVYFHTLKEAIHAFGFKTLKELAEKEGDKGIRSVSLCFEDCETGRFCDWFYLATNPWGKNAGKTAGFWCGGSMDRVRVSKLADVKIAAEFKVEEAA